MTMGVEGHRKRLRERFLNGGLDAFHDHEVMELLLTYAIPRRDVKPIAKAILAEFGGLSAALDAPVERLRQIDGVGGNAAVLIALVPRLLGRYQGDRWKKTPEFHSLDETIPFLTSLLAGEREEVFCVMALNSHNGLIAVERIQRGTVNRTAVFPRQVAEVALKHRATAVILAHNHPGGGAKPSAADRVMTRKLKTVLNELDVAVHDHVIIAGKKSYSFADHGELK